MPGQTIISKLQELSAGSLSTAPDINNIAWPAYSQIETGSGLVDVAIYIRSIGGSGRDRPNERRFQNPAAQNARPITAPESGYALLLGLWTELGDDRAVVVALDAYRRLERETRFSLFMPLDLLHAADRDGTAQCKNASGEILYAFKPPLMGDYVDQLVQRRQDARSAPFPSDMLWGDYRKWNEAIAGEFFSNRSKDKLVYLDLDDAAVKRLGESLDLEEADFRAALTKSVRSTLDLNRKTGSIFFPHLKVLSQWRRESRDQPPSCLGLLALFASVAEGMQADENYASTNYYGRLATALGITGDDNIKVLGQDFRADSTYFWDALNSWLEESDGLCGLPTAFAFDRRRFVSIPISQALVREKDRIRILECFDNFGLRPGQRIAARDMERVLADWLPDSHVSSALKTLWKRKEPRRKIAEIAALELEAWNGVLEGDGRQNSLDRNLMLAIHQRTQPHVTFGFAFIVPESAALIPGIFVPTDFINPTEPILGGKSVRLAEALFRGFFRLTGESPPNFGHALLTDINLKPQSGRGCSVRRRWKPLIVLRFDRETNLFIETKRVELAERHIVLCHQSIANKVETHLNKIAPGCAKSEYVQNSTIPKNWSLFSDVRVAGICSAESDDLQSLVAVASTNIVFDGGLALPARNTWHARHPPTMHVATLNDCDCEVEVLCVQDLSDNEKRTGPMPLGVFSQTDTFDLAGFGLVAGDYRVLIKERRDRSNSIIASAALRLRNSEHRRTIREARLGHSPETQTASWALSAIELPTTIEQPTLVSTSTRNWPTVEVTEPGTTPVPATLCEKIGEVEAPPDIDHQDSASVKIESPTCIKTGVHVWQIPYGGDHPRGHQTLLGSCKHCGLEKWFGSGLAHPRGRPGGQRQRVEIESRIIQMEFSSRALNVSADTLFDALCHIGTSNRRAVANMIETISDRAWLTDEVLRSLSSLGHIEVQLDPLVSQINAWEVARPALNYANEHLVFLSGYRTPSLLKRLREDASALGCRFEVSRQQLAPSRISISGISENDVTELADSINDSIDLPIDVSILPSILIAERLPRLSDVLESLPLIPLSNLPCQYYDLETLKWIDVDKPERRGAYRFRTWTWSYGLVDDELLRSGQQRCGDYRIVKHAAAACSGAPIVAYDAIRKVLSVPLGAELPWIYERAAVLESGLEPVRRTSGCVEYTNVSEQVARLVWSSMGT